MGLTVLDRQDNVKDSPATAQPIAVDLLTKHPDVDAWWAINDTTAARRCRPDLVRGEGAVEDDKGRHPRRGLLRQPTRGRRDQGRAAERCLRLRFGRIRSTAIQALATHYVKGKPVSKMPKVIWINAKRYDFNNIGTYVPYTKRDLYTRNSQSMNAVHESPFNGGGVPIPMER